LASLVKSLRKRVLRKLLSSPGVLFLFLAGVTDLAVLWGFNIDSGLGVFAGLACILGAAGYFLSKWLLGGDKLAKEVIEEMKEEAREKNERDLDELEKRLCEDGDPRTEKNLRDLRELTRAFHESREGSLSLSSKASFEILSGVEQLFGRCVLSLEKTLQLWHTAQRMSRPEAREPILDQRERIIEDVDKSIRQMGKLLAEIQCLGIEKNSEESELARIRKELNQSLEVAKKVEERMQSLDREIDGRRRDGGLSE
jgi:hypothetical protein